MNRFSDRITQPLTLKYLFALGLLAVLAVTNYWLLRIEITESQRMTLVLNNSGRQRMLLHRAAMLAERLVSAPDPAVRLRLRREITSTIDPLEKTHFKLMAPDSQTVAGPSPIKAIYDDAPWLLDSEMRNYILHVRSLNKAPDEELHDNPHFKYVRNPETIDKILNGLDAVVEVYEQRNAAKTAQLRMLATWSLVSTLVVLLLDGWFVFRPMVRRVKVDVDRLNELNETLDRRVAQRTAESERRAEQLARSESALRDSEALYRSLVNNLSMCVLRKDLSGRFTFVNDEFCQLISRRADQIIGCTDADLYPPQLAAKYRADDERVIRTRRPVQDIEQHRTPGGQELYVEVIKAPVRDASGNVIGTQTAFWDVTDRKRAEERARHAERLAAIGQMVAGVAHESRNALQQIQACARMLEWELDGNQSIQSLLADLQSAQDRLHRLFDDLRGYASPLRLNLRPCRIQPLFVQAWTSVEALRNDRDASWRDTSQDELLHCLADAFQLEQVFRNILENALAACEDPVMIEVEYHVKENNESRWLLTTIRDNGPGLSPEQRQRIFEPFYTTRTQGTGLGMAIVKQIVEAHGGTIEARCGKSGGTEIVIALPLSVHAPLTNEDYVERFHA